MPLVISKKAKQVFLVRSEEWLGEILGHSNFDGEDWAVGDQIVFEDGMTSEIVRSRDQKFHVWSEPVPGKLSDVLAAIKSFPAAKGPPKAAVQDWRQLFHEARSLANLRYT